MILLQTQIGSWLSSIASSFQGWAINKFSSWLIQSGWQTAISSLAPVMPYLVVFILGVVFTLIAKGIIRFLVIAISILIVIVYYLLSFGFVH